MVSHCSAACYRSIVVLINVVINESILRDGDVIMYFSLFSLLLLVSDEYNRKQFYCLWITNCSGIEYLWYNTEIVSINDFKIQIKFLAHFTLCCLQLYTMKKVEFGLVCSQNKKNSTTGQLTI